MSIQPPSDIVLDVAQAADPVKSMEATQKLARIAAPGIDDAAFSNVLENVSAPAGQSAMLRSPLSLMNAHTHINQANPADAKTKAYQGLEALVFQNLFETTLPHDSSMGSGMAGDVWRSMLAEQLGKQAAKSIDLGLVPKAAGVQASRPDKGLHQAASHLLAPSLPIEPAGSSS